MADFFIVLIPVGKPGGILRFEYTHDTPGNSPDPELNTCYNSGTRPRGVPNGVVLHQDQNYQLRGMTGGLPAKHDTGQLSSLLHNHWVPPDSYPR